MQRPSCVDVRIRSTRDAHIIFHAVSLGILKAINRRLDPDERAQLRSGCVYAWEERGQHTEVTGLGIERFTEGRRWGPSRVRDEFLFYYEKAPPVHIREKENPMLAELNHKEWDPLVKQTYSVWVDGPRGRRKWHLTAYFTQATVDQLKTVDDFPHLANLEVPLSKYISTRLGKPRRTDDQQGDTVHDFFRSSNPAANRTYAPFPLPYEVTPPSFPPHPNTLPPPPRSPPPPVQYVYPVEARPERSDAARRDVPAAQCYQQRHSGGDSLKLPPLHALSIPGAGSSDRRHAGESTLQPHHPPHDGNSPDQFDDGYSQPQYGSSTSSFMMNGPPSQHTSYYPPTPTSALTPSYETRRLSSNHYGRDGSLREPSFAAPQVPSLPSHPIHCQPSKYSVTPTTPVNQSYPDTYTSCYPHAAMQSRLRQAPSSYTFVPQAQTPVEGQNAVRQPLSLPIDPRLQEYAASPTSYTGLPAAAPSEYASTEPRVRPSIDNAPHAGSHPAPPPPEFREDWDDATQQSPSPSPRSTTSSIGKRLGLAPLRSLTRPHPYGKARNKFDDDTIMAFSGRRNSFNNP